MGDSFIVEVKPSVFSQTQLTEADVDRISNMALSEEGFDNNLQMEFTSREDAEAWVGLLKRDHRSNSRGRIHIHSAHPDDKSEVDAYLQFKVIRYQSWSEWKETYLDGSSSEK